MTDDRAVAARIAANRERQRELYGAPLGERIRRVTRSLQITQGTLARTLGMSPAMLSQLVSGRRVKIGDPAVLGRLMVLDARCAAGTVEPGEAGRLLDEVRSARPGWAGGGLLVAAGTGATVAAPVWGPDPVPGGGAATGGHSAVTEPTARLAGAGGGLDRRAASGPAEESGAGRSRAPVEATSSDPVPGGAGLAWRSGAPVEPAAPGTRRTGATVSGTAGVGTVQFGTAESGRPGSRRIGPATTGSATTGSAAGAAVAAGRRRTGPPVPARLPAPRGPAGLRGLPGARTETVVPMTGPAARRTAADGLRAISGPARLVAAAAALDPAFPELADVLRHAAAFGR